MRDHRHQPLEITRSNEAVRGVQPRTTAEHATTVVDPGCQTLSIEAFLTKLHTTHSHLQKAVLAELTCSENVWKRTLTRIAQLQRKPNS